MTGTVAPATVRLTVSGRAGTTDLVVPGTAGVETVAHAYARALGLADPPSLATLGGRLLAAGETVHGLGLRHGAVLAALDGDAGAPDQTIPGGAETSSRPATNGRGLVLAGLVAGLAAALAAAYAGDGRLRDLTALVLLAGAVAVLLPRSPRRQGARVAAPGLAAAAGLTGLHDGTGGGLLLAVAVAGLAAGAAAALGRTHRDQRLDDLLRVWLVGAGLVTLVAALLLLVGAGVQPLWAVLLAVSVLAAKLLPGSVVDVPDHLLLDLERLAVTAWSARDRPARGRRRRMTVRPGAVVDVVHRGQVLIAAVTVAVAVTVLVCAPLLVAGAGTPVRIVGVRAESFLAGAALALLSRSYRARVPRLALRLSGAWCLVVSALSVLPSLDQTSTLAVVGGVGAIAVLLLVAAVAMGNGWRSVWWARAAEVVEELCVALCLAVLPVAAGLFDAVRQLTS